LKVKLEERVFCLRKTLLRAGMKDSLAKKLETGNLVMESNKARNGGKSLR